MARHAGVEVSAIPVHDENGTLAGVGFRPVEDAIERIGVGFDRHKLQPHRFTFPPLTIRAAAAIMIGRRKLGALDVSAIGFGCMSLTPIYGVPDPDEAIATLHRAPDLGIDFIDTSDAYGANGANEELVGRALKGRREKYILATKFGNIRLPDGKPGAKGNPDYVIEACEKSLKRLGTDTIDLYFIHRIDDTVPIEDTVGAMVRLKTQGKIQHLGISEAGASTIRPPPRHQGPSDARTAAQMSPVAPRRRPGDSPPPQGARHRFRRLPAARPRLFYGHDCGGRPPAAERCPPRHAALSGQ